MLAWVAGGSECMSASAFRAAAPTMIQESVRSRLSGAHVLADAETAPRGPSGFGGVPGMTGFTEAPSPGGAVSEVFHEAEVADRVEYRFKEELRVAGIEGEWHIVPDGDSGGSAVLYRWKRMYTPKVVNR